MNKSDRVHKRGDVRADGYVFVQNAKNCVNGEWWVTPEKFAALESKRRENERRRVNLDPEYHRLRLRIWRNANRERFNSQQRAYCEANRSRYRTIKSSVEAKRRASANKVSLAKADCAIVKVFYETTQRIEKCTGLKFHVDHITPIAKGGAHHPNNLQILPAVINLRKGTKTTHQTHHDPKEDRGPRLRELL